MAAKIGTKCAILEAKFGPSGGGRSAALGRAGGDVDDCPAKESLRVPVGCMVLDRDVRCSCASCKPGVH
jgi:hypothetical protein